MDKTRSNRHLSLFAAWAVSFGTTVGWGAFVMPGTTFLPLAGPLGTIVGVVAGAAVMAVIAWNYHYMSCRMPGAGGTFTFVLRMLGGDHGFFCAWFLCLTYVAIIWANGTALTIVARYLFGDAFRFGFSYSVKGFEVSLGDVLLPAAAILAGAAICCRKRLAGRVQAVLAATFAVGLAICNQLATAMGGRMLVTSEVGRGSTFSIVIPGVKVAPAAPAGSAARPQKAPSAREAGGESRPRRILLVDDSKMNLMVLKALLKKQGDFAVETAMDGTEALEVLTRPGAPHFDLVLTDMWMPNLDGEGLVKAIRSNPALADLPVLVVTADVEIRDKSNTMGFDGILLKPITTATLDKALSGGVK